MFSAASPDDRLAGTDSGHGRSADDRRDGCTAAGLSRRRPSRGLGIQPRPRLEAPMSCCDETTARVPDTNMSRRSLLKGAAVVASAIPARSAQGQGKQIKLAYCSQILCGVPYEVARSAGIFKNHGLDVQL